MTVIAMTREMGTLGKDVAAGVAERLGIKVVHHELVERQLADRLKTSESAVHRFLEGEASLWERWKIDSKRLSRFSSEEVLDLAMQGNVLIRGWGAAQLLRDVSHVICVRVCAPMTHRIDEMKQRLGVDSADIAQREIERNDDAHARAVQRQFQTDWRDPTGYNAIINTAYVPVEVAIAMLQQLSKSGAYEPTDDSRADLLDKLLEARVRSTMDERLPDSPIGTGLGVTVTRGNVVINGVVSRTDSIANDIEAVKQIEGVKTVTDQTIGMTIAYGP
ncbi:MAG: cytidylate kinase [Alphaproteobacteria bacterium]|jgi:cytidylate kinase